MCGPGVMPRYQETTRVQFPSNPPKLSFNAGVAQLVELLISNQIVAGSNPVTRSNSSLKEIAIRYYNRVKKGTMLRVLEEDMQNAQSKIRFINHRKEFVGARHPGYDYAYDAIFLNIWLMFANQPTTIDFGRMNSFSKTEFNKAAELIARRMKTIDSDVYNCAKIFPTFDEFKSFIER
jgi:hypothetical protein